MLRSLVPLRGASSESVIPLRGASSASIVPLRAASSPSLVTVKGAPFSLTRAHFTWRQGPAFPSDLKQYLQNVKQLDKKPIEICETIEGGSQARVYRGKLTVEERKVDVIVKELRRFSLIRFIQEARILSILSGMGGTPEFYGIITNPPSLVMEYCPGKTMEECLMKEHPSLVLRGMAQACDIIQEMHDRGIIHMDIHDKNILMDITGNVVQAKVIDFGSSQIKNPGILSEFERIENIRLTMIVVAFIPFLEPNAKRTNEFIRTLDKSFHQPEPPTPGELAHSLRSATLSLSSKS